LLSKNLKIKTYRTIILSVVLYGRETWSLTLREECRLRVFEIRVTRRIFGPQGDEMTGKWEKLNNADFNYEYCQPNTVQVIKWGRMKWAGRVECMGERRGGYWVLVGKSGGKRSLGRPKHSWEDNIKIDLQEV
jgi:hypothetical protein